MIYVNIIKYFPEKCYYSYVIGMTKEFNNWERTVNYFLYFVCPITIMRENCDLFPIFHVIASSLLFPIGISHDCASLCWLTKGQSKYWLGYRGEPSFGHQNVSLILRGIVLRLLSKWKVAVKDFLLIVNQTEVRSGHN